MNLNSKIRGIAKVALSVFAIFATNNSANANDYWHIKSTHYACLIDNINIYQSVSDNDVIIFLDECPEVDVVKIISNRAQNSALPDVGRKDQTVDQPAEVIVLSKESLSCLVNLNVPDESGLVLLPKEPCRK